ncbi:MAG: hypothetical protein HC767_08255 [Akkermansiaceae bacterium]|nr:hypothetical protein [Akkermansiaceae bacterium]
MQDAKDQVQASAQEQQAVDQENQRLQRELAAAAEVLEAKRAKKRMWKAQCMTHDENTAELRQLLKDKQFAVEKSMQRFKALEARVEAGTHLKKDTVDEHAQHKPRDVADLEAILAQQRETCITLQEQLNAAKEVQPTQFLAQRSSRCETALQPTYVGPCRRKLTHRISWTAPFRIPTVRRNSCQLPKMH